MANYILNYSGPQVNEKLGSINENLPAAENGLDLSLVTTGDKFLWNNKANNAIATQTTAGLMSAEDKVVLDSLNPNVEVTIDYEYAPSIIITNAKQENLVNLGAIVEPKISGRIRTNNLLDASDIQQTGYISGTGVVTQGTGVNTDVIGPFMPVTPGQDIYYTGILGPNSENRSYNRRLHVYDSNQNWIKQINYTSVTGVNTSWSTHGVIPENGAYVRVSWNQGDYRLMVTEGEPTKYNPYYITPFIPIDSIIVYVSPDENIENATAYTINIPQEAGDLYSLGFETGTGILRDSTRHIAEYDGTPLNTTYWWSDRDTYDPSLSPSIGAEVVYVVDEEDYIDYNFTPITIPLNYHNNHIWVENGTIAKITYYAETLAVNHLTIGYGYTMGENTIIAENIIAWNQAASAINSKANIESPEFTGVPLAPNPGRTSNTTRIATTNFVQTLFNNIAKVESKSTASTDYEIGDYMMHYGQLYKVTAAIASGTTLTEGTNIETTTVMDEFKNLLSSLS